MVLYPTVYIVYCYFKINFIFQLFARVCFAELILARLPRRVKFRADDILFFFVVVVVFSWLGWGGRVEFFFRGWGVRFFYIPCKLSPVNGDNFICMKCQSLFLEEKNKLRKIINFSTAEIVQRV